MILFDKNKKDCCIQVEAKFSAIQANNQRKINGSIVMEKIFRPFQNAGPWKICSIF